MLMNLTHLRRKHKLTITGVLHVGAHLGEEAEIYARNGIETVYWVEGNPALIEPLYDHVSRYGHKIYDALVSDEAGKTVTFHITNNGQSSSLLEFGTHTKVSPDVHFVDHIELKTTTLDNLVREWKITGFNFLNMDLQGAELLALQGGMVNVLPFVDAIYTEINVDELYKGCVRLPELDSWLGARGFIRVETAMAGEAGWGDALYVRRGSLHPKVPSHKARIAG